VAKAEGAFRTIGEVSAELGIPQHILRYWETRFPQLKPLQRAGQRRYYRPDDVALVRRIDTLLNREGYTVRGVQQVLAGGGGEAIASAASAPPAVEPPAGPAPAEPEGLPDITVELRAIRDELAAALQRLR
jgi:DNA-binding transcriptional MerR regulator